LLLGKRGLAAELGHVTVDPEGPICTCGERGHLEAIASGTAITRWVIGELKSGSQSSLQGIENLSSEKIAMAAENGDPLAVSAFKRAGHWFGRSLADFLHIFNPSAIIIGGGVSKSWNLIFDPIMQSLEERVISAQYCRDLVIEPAQLGDQAGLAGAYAAAQSLNRT
jgi:glucokinase